MMRTVRLARVAARAETVRIKRLVLRSVRRVAFAAVALVFAIACLVLLHALGFEALTQFAGMAPFWALLIVFGVDVVFAVIFGILAAGGERWPAMRYWAAPADCSVVAARASASPLARLWCAACCGAPVDRRSRRPQARARREQARPCLSSDATLSRTRSQRGQAWPRSR